jgi:hypothetical protein
MNDTSTESELTAGDLPALAGFIYEKLPGLVEIECALAEFTVLDVHALADVDNVKMVVNAADGFTRQSYGPGTYLLVKVDGLEVHPDEVGLIAFLPEGV